MISTVMFAKSPSGEPLYEVENFHLDRTNTAESLARDNVERHKGNDEMVVRAARAILQGRLLRYKDEATCSGEVSTGHSEHIEELEQLDVFLEKALQAQNLRFRCGFPHLIARKI